MTNYIDRTFRQFLRKFDRQHPTRPQAQPFGSIENETVVSGNLKVVVVKAKDKERYVSAFMVELVRMVRHDLGYRRAFYEAADALDDEHRARLRSEIYRQLLLPTYGDDFPHIIIAEALTRTINELAKDKGYEPEEFDD